MEVLRSKMKRKVRKVRKRTALCLVISWMFRNSCEVDVYHKHKYLVGINMARIMFGYWDYLDYPAGNQIHSEYLHDRNKPSCVRISNDGRYAFIGLNDGEIFKYDLIQNRRVSVLQKTTLEVYSMDINDTHLVSGGFGNGFIWNIKNEEILTNFFTRAWYKMLSIDLNSKGDQFVVGSDDNTIRIWSVPDGKLLSVLGYHTGSVENLIFLGDWIYSGCDQGMINVWNRSNESCIFTDDHSHSIVICGLSINCNKTMLISVTFKKMIVWSLPSLEISSKIPALRAHQVCCHPKRPNIVGIVAYTIQAWEVRVINLNSKSIVCTLGTHSEFIRDIQFTPDGTRLISVSDDASIAVWDLPPYF